MYNLLVMTALFMNVGGSSLDTHHGFVVEYAMDRDLDLGECTLELAIYQTVPCPCLVFSSYVPIFGCRTLLVDSVRH
jgi:hypothetical protein